MQQVVKAVDEQSQQGSKTHQYSDPYVDNAIDFNLSRVWDKDPKGRTIIFGYTRISLGL